jgi:hypothetical protein
LVLAFVAAALFVGDRLSGLFGWERKSLYIKAILGVFSVGAIKVLADLFDAIGIHFMAAFFSSIFAIIAFISLTFGLGAVVIARFGVKPKPSPPTGVKPAPTVKPPPPPSVDTPPSPTLRTPPPPGSISSDATDQEDNSSNKS